MSAIGDKRGFPRDTSQMMSAAAGKLMVEPLLDVTGLKTHFVTDHGIVRAVDGVSFHINAGETLGLVDESGSGKSVTGLSIMRLIREPPGRIAEGEIRYNGVNLLDLSNEQMRKICGKEIAMIFQEPMSSLAPRQWTILKEGVT